MRRHYHYSSIIYYPFLFVKQNSDWLVLVKVASGNGDRHRTAQLKPVQSARKCQPLIPRARKTSNSEEVLRYS